MCKVLNIQRSTVYKVLAHKPSKMEINNQEFEYELIKAFYDYDEIYGATKLQRVLKVRGFKSSVERISRYMKRLGLKSKTVKIYSRKGTSPVPDDKENILNRDFSTDNINEKWATDITYIYTYNKGWTYLCSVLDLHSKKIIGYSYKVSMTTELVMIALKAAISSTNSTKDVIIQTDLGSQFLSDEFENELLKHGIIHSYSRKGCPQDNSPIENFHSLIKREYIHHIKFKTFKEASLGIFSYIEGFYNRNRIHGSINYETPHDLHERLSSV